MLQLCVASDQPMARSISWDTITRKCAIGMFLDRFIRKCLQSIIIPDCRARMRDSNDPIVGVFINH